MPTHDPDRDEALSRDRAELEAVRGRWPLISRVTAVLDEMREQNHFAQRIERARQT